MLDNLKKYNIVLASKSPRRQELLKGIGIDFSIQTKEVDESYQNNAASDTQKPDSPDEQRVTPEQVEEARKRQQNMNT